MHPGQQPSIFEVPAGDENSMFVSVRPADMHDLLRRYMAALLKRAPGADRGA